MNTDFTTTQIAQITAAITGGGFKRAANKDAALRRLTSAISEAGVKDERPAGTIATFLLTRPTIDEALERARKIRAGLSVEDAIAGHPKAKANEASWDKIPDKGTNSGAAKAKPAPKEAAAKPAGDGPRPGTKARITFDLMKQDGGTTMKESAAAGGMNESLSDVADRFAKSFCLSVNKIKDGRHTRYALI